MPVGESETAGPARGGAGGASGIGGVNRVGGAGGTADDLSVRAVERRDERAGAVALLAIVAVMVAWFGVSWLALNSPVLDAAGEAAGGVLTLLVLVSVVGAVRRSRD